MGSNPRPIKDNRLREELKKIINSSKGRKHTDYLVEILRTHPEWHDCLLDIYLSDEEPFSRRLVWAIDLYSMENTGIVTPYLETIAKMLPLFSHDGLRRHSLHILSRFPLPETELGSLTSICFDWLMKPGYPAAIKVHCMEILYHISLSVPEISKELSECIEFRLNEETPGFKNRGLKILKNISLQPGGKS
ncbi:MAG: hypothetical protein NTX43_00630 [Bacteroidetes bacterium]|nr:hypothetical protein [Bacteroidota bacterium]